MSIHDAQPGDIYVDDAGALWRVMSVIQEPSVTVQAVEPTTATALGMLRGLHPIEQRFGPVERHYETKSGGVSGVMWQGFKRIWRRKEAA